MLYINQGKKKMADGTEIVTFTEQAKAFNLADANRGIQSSFFDYDRDGDLDVFISNTPDFEDKGSVVLDLTQIQSAPETIAKKGSDRLYRNEGNGTFIDISAKPGSSPTSDLA